MIFTSNFKIAGRLPQAVAISRGFPGVARPPMQGAGPPRDLIKIMEPERFIPLTGPRSWTSWTP